MTSQAAIAANTPAPIPSLIHGSLDRRPASPNSGGHPRLTDGYHSITLRIDRQKRCMSSLGPKQHVFASLAEIAQALGHAHRLELLEHLGQGERSVEGLAACAGLTLANTSRHLQLLRRAGLVRGRREGKRVYYRLAEEDAVVGLLGALGLVGERSSAEIARVMASYFRARDELEPVSREELLDRLRSGVVTLLDVRPEDEFARGHLAGALNVPLAQLELRLAELPPDREVVAYCRGPWCVLSFEAVALLRHRGYLVRRLEDGFPEWKVAGLPVESAQ
jgi:ArsR family transcriptional regulator